MTGEIVGGNACISMQSCSCKNGDNVKNSDDSIREFFAIGIAVSSPRPQSKRIRYQTAGMKVKAFTRIPLVKIRDAHRKV